MENCRKGFQRSSGFRPEYFENFYNNDPVLIKSMMDKKEKYEKGEITYEDLQQFYANHDILPPFSKYKKVKSITEIAMEEYLESFPQPKPLTGRTIEKLYQGHKIRLEKMDTVKPTDSGMNTTLSLTSEMKKSRSALKCDKDKSMTAASMKELALSKISFKFDDDYDGRKSKKKRLSDDRPSKKLSFGGMEKKGGLLTSESIEEVGQQPNVGKLLTKREVMNMRKKCVMAGPVATEPFGPRNKKEQCLAVLEEIFNSIPEKEEYCDSEKGRTADLKKLSEDKFNVLKYWGKRMLTLSFDDPLKPQ